MKTQGTQLSQQHENMLEALTQLGNNADFGILKTHIKQMYFCAQPHEAFDHSETRVEMSFSFAHLYNFFSLMEMFTDQTIKGVNLL